MMMKWAMTADGYYFVLSLSLCVCVCLYGLKYVDSRLHTETRRRKTPMGLGDFEKENHTAIISGPGGTLCKARPLAWPGWPTWENGLLVLVLPLHGDVRDLSNTRLPPPSPRLQGRIISDREPCSAASERRLV